jgi:hypothetical protein
MALGLFLAGLSGAAALAHFGDHYRQFFLWITACAAVTFATLWKLPLAGDFGKKENAP